MIYYQIKKGSWGWLITINKVNHFTVNIYNPKIQDKGQSTMWLLYDKVQRSSIFIVKKITNFAFWVWVKQFLICIKNNLFAPILIQSLNKFNFYSYTKPFIEFTHNTDLLHTHTTFKTIIIIATYTTMDFWIFFFPTEIFFILDKLFYICYRIPIYCVMLETFCVNKQNKMSMTQHLRLFFVSHCTMSLRFK